MTSSKQRSLFGDRTDKVVRVAEAIDSGRPADKAQATFRRLVTQIEQQRTLLQIWKDYGGRYHQRVTAELLPLQNELAQARRQMALLLEASLEKPGCIKGKRLRSTARQMLIELIRDLLPELPDAELEAIHNKYAGVPYGEDQDLQLALSQQMFENMYGIDMGDDIKTMDELFARAHEKMHGGAAPKAPDGDEPLPGPQRQEKKAQQAEALREQAAKEVSQSVREVYRKLASALHPDRENDADLRQQKTAQMSRVNQAYEAGDLLGLLNIQLEIEQIDADHLTSLSAQRLAHYNQVLREQLDELKAEIQMLITPFIMLAPYARKFLPEHVDRALTADLVNLQSVLTEIRRDLEEFKDPTKLALALWDFESAEDGFGMDDLAQLAELSIIADLLAPSTKPGGRSGRRRKK